MMKLAGASGAFDPRPVHVDELRRCSVSAGDSVKLHVKAARPMAFDFPSEMGTT
jgi:hypothetical protein